MSHTDSAHSLTAGFWEGAGAGRLMIPHCNGCRQWQWPVKYRCTRCDGELAWKQATGRGVLLSWSTVLRAPRPELQPLVPYIIAFVRLDEGVVLMTHIKDASGQGLTADKPVVCSFEWMPGASGAARLPVFSIVEG